MEKYNDFTETKNVTLNPSKHDYSYVDYAGDGIVSHFENKPKRYKIKTKKAFEHEIDQETKNVTINALVTGAFAIGTIVCFSMMNSEALEFTRKAGLFLGGVMGTGELYYSSKVLVESMKRKLKLEDKYFDTYGEEYEEKKR